MPRRPKRLVDPNDADNQEMSRTKKRRQPPHSTAPSPVPGNQGSDSAVTQTGPNRPITPSTTTPSTTTPPTTTHPAITPSKRNPSKRTPSKRTPSKRTPSKRTPTKRTISKRTPSKSTLSNSTSQLSKSIKKTTNTAPDAPSSLNIPSTPMQTCFPPKPVMHPSARSGSAAEPSETPQNIPSSAAPPPTSSTQPTTPVASARARVQPDSPPVSTTEDVQAVPVLPTEDIEEVPVQSDDVEEISVQSDDVEEVPTTGDVQHIPDVPPFTITDYDFLNGFVSLEHVRIPPYTPREVSETHVTGLRKLFEAKSFNPVIGAFIVAQPTDEPKPIQFDRERTLVGSSMLVDGRHRFTAVHQLYTAEPDKWSHLWKKAPVACVQRKDGKEITSLEILSLAAYFNDLSSAVLKVSFLDHVHAAIQTVRIIASYKTTATSSLTVGEITKELQERRTLGDIDERQLRRYAAVARKLAVHADFYKTLKKVMKSCPGVGLVHLNSPLLLSITDLNLWHLSVASVRSLLLNGVRGSFEQMHASFYGCVKKLFELLQKTASYKEISLESLLESELYITAHDPKTVFEYIADTMSRYALVEKQDAADNTRLRNLKKKLVALLGDDIEPSNTAVQQPADQNTAPSQAAAVSVDPQVARKEGPRRSERKRPARTAASKKDSNSDVATPRPAKKQKAKPVLRNVARQKALSENKVSTFLKTLAPADLTRLMDNLGVQIVLKPGSRSQSSPRHFETEAMESTAPLEVLPTFYDSFNDSLPGTLPEAWADPTPYDGEDQPSWLRFLTKIPSKWPTQNPIAHVSPWLEATHVPHEHRAHSVITNPDLLRQNHHAVYYRAAHSYLKQRPATELPDLKERFGEGLSKADERLWCSAVVEDDAALEFFGTKTEQLSSQGFCILESFLNDAQMPETVGTFHFPRFTSPKPFFKSLEDEAFASFPGEEALSNPEARTTWNVMQNVSGSVDSAAVIQGQGRFRMTNYGILERLEADPDKVWTINARALVDIRVAQCMVALKLTFRHGSTPLFVPRTGGRWIITSQKCERQSLHTDFKPLTRHETLSENKTPGYFTIATGQHEVAIWICSHSHRLAATSSSSKLRAASSASSTHLVRIPPFSIFVGRGDLYYAGLAAADAMENRRSIYYHTFFIPEGEDIPRVLNKNPQFNPRFVANIDDESDSDSNKSLDPHRKPTSGSVKQPRERTDSGEEYGTYEMSEGEDDNDAASISERDNGSGGDKEDDGESEEGGNDNNEDDHQDNDDVDYSEYV